MNITLRSTGDSFKITAIKSISTSIDSDEALSYGSATLNKPSFDCAKARTAIEKSICSNPKLGDIDGNMGELYRQVRRSLWGNQAKLFVNEQKAWITRRDAYCGAYDTECLIGVYQERISQLQRRL